MKEYQSQSHVRYECKYHIVWCPKCRRKKLYGQLRRRFGEIMHDLCCQKGVELIEGHACPDHVPGLPSGFTTALLVMFKAGGTCESFGHSPTG